MTGYFSWFVRIKKKFHLHADICTPMNAPVLSGVLMQFCYVLSWFFCFVFTLGAIPRAKKKKREPAQRAARPKRRPRHNERISAINPKLSQRLNPAIIWCLNSPHHCFSASSCKRCLKPCRIFYRPKSELDPTNSPGTATVNHGGQWSVYRYSAWNHFWHLFCPNTLFWKLLGHVVTKRLKT